MSLGEHGVTFRTRGDKTVTIAPGEFLRRFVLHVLPKGFVKIRHHGLMAPSHVSTKLAVARRLIEGAGHVQTSSAPAPRAPSDFRDLLLVLTGVDLRRCPRCLVGTMTPHPLSSLPGDARIGAPSPPDTS